VDKHSVKLTVYSASLSADSSPMRSGSSRMSTGIAATWRLADVRRGGRACGSAAGVPGETSASAQLSAPLTRLASSAPRIARLAAEPGREVTLSVGYFINDPQWQDHDDGTLVRGLGVALNSVQIDLLHACTPSSTLAA
jgi:hypothetical protein